MFRFATASQIVFGPGALHELPRHVRGLGARAAVVMGKSGRLAQRLSELLAEAGVAPSVIGIEGEPKVRQIRELVPWVREQGCEFVVAVGGGSVIDAGKALAALSANPGDALDYLEVVGKGLPLGRPPLPFIAVPTTAGTGAEVTKNAVLGSEEHRVKVSLRSESMLPRLALIDPELTLSVPPEVTAATGLDALTQVIEPFVSCHANAITDAFCRDGLSRAARSLRRAVTNGDCLEARTDMALASLMGGLALANAKLGAVHGLAGPLGGRFPAPHGAACARLLPKVVRANVAALRARASGSPYLERFDEVARLLTADPHAAADDAAPWLERLVTDLSVAPLGTYGLSERDVPDLVHAALRSSSMQGNPIVLSAEELAAVVVAAL